MLRSKLALPENLPNGRPDDVLLECHEVSKRFRHRAVLCDVSLRVHAGEAVAIVGENGSGKSTLLRIISGLLAQDSGQAFVRGRLGYCPQDPGVFDLLTIQEHLTLSSRAATQSAPAAVRRGWDLLAEFGLRLGSERRALVMDLSGGARQKLNLAIALLSDPDILLLDEPYQGLDMGSYMAFWDQVELWKADRKAVVIVSHMLAELRRVDRAIVVLGVDVSGTKETVGG